MNTNQPPERLEAVITATVLDSPPFTLRENVANGTYRGIPLQLDRSLEGSVHWIIFQGKAYEFDVNNIMVAILDQNYIAENKGKR